MPYLDARLDWAGLLFLVTTLHCSSDGETASTSDSGSSTSSSVNANTGSATGGSAAQTTASSSTGSANGSVGGTTTTTTATTTATTSLGGAGGAGGSGGASETTEGASTGSFGGSAGSGSSGDQPFKGVANSPCDARTALGVSWYYNWMQYEDDPCQGDTGGEFVPMIWGHPGDEQSESGIENAIAAFVSGGLSHVLGFNEPDNPDQSNIPVTAAVSLLGAFDNPGIVVGSPATAANADPGQVWFDGFMAELEADPSLRVDFLAIHWYGWNEGSCGANAAELESYINWVEGFAGDRPIWLTEWGCLNNSAPSMQTVTEFYQGAIAMFENHPRVERYAWYPWSTNCKLNEEDGSLTSLGEAFAAAPARR